MAENKETQITTVETEAVVLFQPENASQAAKLASWLAKSNLLPTALRGKPADVLVTLITGHELGISPMQAVRGMHVIEGKAVASADLMGALVRRNREVCMYLRLAESDDQHATYETQRAGDPEATRMTYTIEQAAKAGLAGKDNWKKHPAAMLRARCLSAITRAVYPDMVLGVYDIDEALEFNGHRPVNVTPRATTAEIENDAEPAIQPQRRSAAKQPVTPQSSPPEPTDDNKGIWTGKVTDVTEKSGVKNDKPWTIYSIHGHGEKFDTFSSTDAEAARGAMEEALMVEVTWEQGQYGKKLIEIVPAPDDDLPPVPF